MTGGSAARIRYYAVRGKRRVRIEGVGSGAE